MVQSKAIIFKAIPEGWPVAGEHLTVETSDFDLNQELPAGSIIAHVIYSSFDPYMRGRMRDAAKKSYSPPFILNEPMNAGSVAIVEKSANDAFKAGDEVTGFLPITNYALLNAEAVKASGLRKIDNPYNLDLYHFIGALGMPGLTAYSSFYDIGKPKKGETIFVSAASGAVGQIVGQLAKHEGLTVIGSVGDDAKLEFITKELKFDAGFNYKKEPAAEALQRLAPNGIDIYYENVGGEQLDAALLALNNFGRIIACGMISGYNKKPGEGYGVKNLMNIVTKRLTMRGFIVGDPNMGPVYAKEHRENLSKWLKDGSFVAKVSMTEGIENGPEGLVGLFEGKNFGKAVLKL